MHEPTLPPDDPRLTAYALGELSGDERAHIEAALRDNLELRTIVEEIRATAAQIEDALAAEALAELEPVETGWNGLTASRGDEARVADEPRPQAAAANEPDYDRRGRKVLRFPQLYGILATAAAACFAVFFALRNDEYATRQQAEETLARIAQRKQQAEARAAAAKPSSMLVTLGAAKNPDSEVIATAVPAAPVAAPAVENTVHTPAPEPEKNRLALLELTKPEPGATPGESLIAPAVKFSLDSPAAPSTEKTPAATPLIAQAPVAPATPGVPANAVTETTRTKDLARGREGSAATAVFNAPASPVAPAPSDEIVMLDTFAVSADRIQSFIGSGAFNTFTTITRGIPEREPLPRPPAGAQFGTTKAVLSFAGDNDFVRVSDSPISKLPVDVDTASYTNVRRMIESGRLPPRDAVRIEELVNYFPYAYAAPKNDQPFAAALEVAAAPWAPGHRLVRIALQAREIATAQRGPANLVFLLDVSASMGEPNKLPLVRESLLLLLSKLRSDDRVAIITYAETPVVVLPSTPVAHTEEIIGALNALKAAGMTDAAGGLQLAYRVALQHFTRSGMNRVLLCTDGGFNTGTTSERELLQLIDEKTRSGIALTMLGFGRANEHSTPLERLAHRASATYGYIDSRREAEKQLVEQVSSALATIARDVKVQVEFNAAKVLAYRLIGYENRPLRREDYSEETGAVGEVGAGQAVTALYEVIPAVPADAAAKAKSDYVRYGALGVSSSRLETPDTSKPPGPELVTVNVRYKNPNAILGWPRTQEFAVTDTNREFDDASADFRFAAAVAEFGMILRGSPHKGAGTIRDVIAWANTAAGAAEDPHGYRRDFIALARKASILLR